MSNKDTKEIAYEFASWLESTRWKIEYSEQRTFTLDELYDVFYTEYLSRQ